MRNSFFVLIVLLCLEIPMACSNNPTGPGIPTATPVPTATNWAGFTSTNTVTSTITPTATSTPTSTATNLNGYTSTFTFTSTITFTPTITSTPTSTPTSTATNTPTNTPTSTNTFSAPVPSPSGTPWKTAYAPNGIAMNSAGTTVYVAEGVGGGYPGLIQSYNASGITLAAPWYTNGSGVSFGQPNGVAVNASGNLYVVDGVNNAVYELNSSGSLVTSWAGYGSTSFQEPEGIALDPDGNVYVADTDNNQVEEFTPDGSATLNVWTGGTTAFDTPSAVAIGVNAGVTYLYVADAGNDLVQTYQLNSGPWSSFSTSIFSTMAGSDIFGITFNGGNLYLADSGTGQVEEVDTNGNQIKVWHGPYPLATSSPDGVIVTGSGDVLVTDFYNLAVEKFGP